MEDKLDPKIKELLESHIQELDRMSGIINNLISLKNMVRPEKVKFENVDIGLIADAVFIKLKSLAEKKFLEVTTKKVAPNIVWGNAVAIEQIITNLLKNAINYTNENGRITIKIGPDYMGSVILQIEDTGIGIGKKDLLHIFEPFYRAERSRNKQRGSSGLGLTIVSELVKMHSGKISIRSAENKGTTVIITFPYARQNIDVEQHIEFSRLNEISVNFLEQNRK
jgi:signal transduction histidine kinase